jgi:hypothetical protein
MLNAVVVLITRNAGECWADDDRFLTVSMTKCGDQHRGIVAVNVMQERFRARQRRLFDWGSVNLQGGGLLLAGVRGCRPTPWRYAICSITMHWPHFQAGLAAAVSVMRLRISHTVTLISLAP